MSGVVAVGLDEKRGVVRKTTPLLCKSGTVAPNYFMVCITR